VFKTPAACYRSACRAGWRQENLAENAAEISALGKDLFKRLSDMGEHLNRVGKSLRNAVEAFNGLWGRWRDACW
jgi:DNA anti-recombination protein RmuC